MKSLADALSDFRQAREKMQRLEDQTPNIIGVEALKVIDQNFENESYDSGTGKTRWEARASSTNKGYDSRSGVQGSVFSSSNPILQQTGNLRDSIKKKVQGRTVFIGVNLDKVPYAKIHNEGGQITIAARTQAIYFKAGRFSKRMKGTRKRRVHMPGHSITMPKRQYMPMPNERPNVKILKAAHKKLIFERDKIMKAFKKV